MILFRALDTKEREKFRKWARINYKTLQPITGHWHPVVQHECVLMNVEHSDPSLLDICKEGEVSVLS